MMVIIYIFKYYFNFFKCLLCYIIDKYIIILNNNEVENESLMVCRLRGDGGAAEDDDERFGCNAR